MFHNFFSTIPINIIGHLYNSPDNIMVTSLKIRGKCALKLQLKKEHLKKNSIYFKRKRVFRTRSCSFGLHLYISSFHKNYDHKEVPLFRLKYIF